MTKRAARPQSYRPNHCLVLAVDPGARFGWAIVLADRVLDYGELAGLDFAAVQTVVADTLGLAEISEVPCVLVIERPPVHHRGGKRSFRSLLGSGETRASWRLAWRAANQPDRRRITVDVLEWRRAVGIGRLPREAAKTLELASAVLVMRADGHASPAGAVGPESAPAILIGCWACRAGEVRAVLPRGAQ